MGDHNQLRYLRNKVPTVNGAVLEVGSKEHGSTSSFREFYKDATAYVGIDMQPGDGVDIVADICTANITDLGGPYSLAICCSVLEHVREPWKFAANLSALVMPGGQLYLSVPWVWRYHPYPDDYWRFSWSGIKVLFPDFEWEEGAFSTNVPGEFFRAIEGADDRLSGHVDERKFLPYLMLNMLGVKRAPAQSPDWRCQDCGCRTCICGDPAGLAEKGYDYR